MIRCKWIQWQIERHMDARTCPPPKLTEHMAQCPRCQNAVRQLEKIHNLLSRPTADRLTHVQHSRIQTAVLHRLDSAALPQKTLFSVWPRVAAVAAVLLIGVLLLHHPTTPPAPPMSPTPLPALASDVEIFGHTLPQLGKLAEEPLQRELYNLTLDAHRAAAFLLNCTPLSFSGENL